MSHVIPSFPSCVTSEVITKDGIEAELLEPHPVVKRDPSAYLNNVRIGRTREKCLYLLDLAFWNDNDALRQVMSHAKWDGAAALCKSRGGPSKKNMELKYTKLFQVSCVKGRGIVCASKTKEA